MQALAKARVLWSWWSVPKARAMSRSVSAPDQPLTAALLMLGFAVVIGFVDNFVRQIAAEAGIWQFHLVRTLMALTLFALAARIWGLDLRPRNLRAVAARSVVHGAAMLLYFASLASLSVAETVAGLFTAPIFVLILSRFLFGHRLRPVHLVAVALGFAGVVLVLLPGAGASVGWTTLMPVAAGALYALANLATREWCPGEGTAVLTLGFFVAMGVAGVLGVTALALIPVDAPPGADGFLLRGWVWPGPGFWFWTAVQAVGSILAVGLLMRAYQLAEASRVSVFEYSLLPVAAGWTWLLWGDLPGASAVLGMGLIAIAGALVALRQR